MDRFVPLGRGSESRRPPSPCMLAAWARHDERDGGQGALLGSTRLTSTATPCMHPPPSRGGGAGRPASCCWWTRGGAREDPRPSRVVVVPCLPRNQRPGSVLQGENTCIDHLERLFCMPRLVAGLLARCRAFGAASSSIHQDKFRTSFLLLVTLDLSDTTLVLFSALHASCMPAGRGTG